MCDIVPLSRQGLVGWVNDTLQLNISKLDELGTGAAYCQFMDMVFGDLPMAKVKFDARNEYESLQNYKILQACFTKHKIDHPFDAPRLAKCRLQDNLDFTQWIYKFVLTEGAIPEYDPATRRKALPVPSTPGNAPRTTSRMSITGTARATSATARRQTRSVSNSSNGSRQSELSASRQSSVSRQASGRVNGGPSAGRDQRVADLTSQLEEYSHNLDVATTERTLYYGKLLEIEDLVQGELERIYDEDPNAGITETPEMLLLRNIQSVLFARAEGFETPYRPEDEPF